MRPEAELDPQCIMTSSHESRNASGLSASSAPAHLKPDPAQCADGADLDDSWSVLWPGIPM